MVINTATENEENIHIAPLSGDHPNTSIASPMSIEMPATTATPDTPISASTRRTHRSDTATFEQNKRIFLSTLPRAEFNTEEVCSYFSLS